MLLNIIGGIIGSKALGLNKSTAGWAQTYVNEQVPEDAACGKGGAQILQSDLDANINDLAEGCASYVVSKRKGASRSNALSACRADIENKMHCTIAAANSDSYNQNKQLTDQLGKINYLPYIIAFLFVGVIFYLLKSK